MNELLNQISVKVSILGETNVQNQGSGFLFKGKSCFFVITAYHCIYGDEEANVELSMECISIERQETFNSNFIRYGVNKIIAHNQEEDWAILDVNYIDLNSNFPEYKLAGNFNTNTAVTFRGFQNVDQNSGRSFGSRVLERTSNNEFKITLNANEDFKDGSEHAYGLSGSGAFVIEDDKLYLLGLLKSVKGDNTLNNDIKCCPISALNEHIDEELVDIGMSTEFDKTAENEFEKVIISDARDLNEKIIDVCPEIKSYRLGKFTRDLSSGKIELQRYSEREMSAVKFRIFEACQEELMNFVESRETENVTIEEINDLITIFTQKAETILSTKSVLYKYPRIDNDLLRRVILDLINDCFLSFDKAGIYEE